MEEHTSELRQIREGDRVSIETTDGESLEADCTSYEKQHSRNPDIVRTSFYWYFEFDGEKAVATIVEGLKSSPDEAEYPRHKKLFNLSNETGMGYITSIEVME